MKWYFQFLGKKKVFTTKYVLPQGFSNVLDYMTKLHEAWLVPQEVYGLVY